MEAGDLTSLVDVTLARAWRRDSELHGDEHWRCVTASGLALAPRIGGVDRTLVFCFGLLHDTRRLNDAIDPDHGPRAASFARELRAEGVLMADDGRFALLLDALTHHSAGFVSDEPTIGTCWDADRLHLPRVSISPRADLFSTRAARGRAPLEAASLLRTDGPPSWERLAATVPHDGSFAHVDGR
jgi:uncharacterized protein